MKIVFEPFSLVTHRDDYAYSVGLFLGTRELARWSEYNSEIHAIQGGIAKFRKMMTNGLSDSEGQPCILRQEPRTARQLSDGSWLVDDKVYSDADFRRLFVL